jgi:hypothetical protein
VRVSEIVRIAIFTGTNGRSWSKPGIDCFP